MTAWGALVQQRRYQHVGDTGGDGDDNVGDSGAGSDGAVLPAVAASATTRETAVLVAAAVASIGTVTAEGKCSNYHDDCRVACGSCALLDDLPHE